MSRHRHFDPSRLLGEGNDSHESLPSSRLPSNRLTHSSHDATRLARLLAAEGKEDESDLLAVVRVFCRRWRTAARFDAIIMAVTASLTRVTTTPYPSAAPNS